MIAIRWDQARAKSQLSLRKPYKPVGPIGPVFFSMLEDKTCPCGCGYFECANPHKLFFGLDIGDRVFLDGKRGVVVQLDHEHGLILLSTGPLTEKTVSWDVLVNGGWKREFQIAPSPYALKDGLPLFVGDRVQCVNGQEAVVIHLGEIVESRPIRVRLIKGGDHRLAMSLGYMRDYWSRSAVC